MAGYSMRDARRESYSTVPETCPAVDAALAAAGELIKDQTTSLRDAMIDALERAITAEERAEELERGMDELHGRVRELEKELEIAQELSERAGA